MLRILINILIEFIERLIKDELSLTVLTCNWGDNPIPGCKTNDTSIPMAYFLGMTRFNEMPSHIKAGHVSCDNVNPIHKPFIIQDSRYNNLIMFHIMVNRGIINVTMKVGYMIIGGRPDIEIIKIDYFKSDIDKPSEQIANIKIRELNTYIELLSKRLPTLAGKQKKEMLDLF